MGPSLRITIYLSNKVTIRLRLIYGFGLVDYPSCCIWVSIFRFIFGFGIQDLTRASSLKILISQVSGDGDMKAGVIIPQ